MRNDTRITDYKIFSEPKFRKALAHTVTDYLQSDTVNPLRHLKEIERIYDTIPEGDSYNTYRECAETVSMYISSIYNHYLGFLEVSPVTKVLTVEEKYKRRELELRVMRYTKSMFKKGKSYGELMLYV